MINQKLKVDLWNIAGNMMRAHVESGKLKKALLEIQKSEIVNYYYRKDNLYGWDVEFPMQHRKYVERLLQIKTAKI